MGLLAYRGAGLGDSMRKRSTARCHGSSERCACRSSSDARRLARIPRRPSVVGR